MSGIKVRRRTDGLVERWQVDFPVLLPGALRTTRKRYTAPANVTSKSGAVRWAEAARREIEAGRPVRGWRRQEPTTGGHTADRGGWSQTHGNPYATREEAALALRWMILRRAAEAVLRLLRHTEGA